MQKITPHLWFAQGAKEAAEFYVSVFGEESRVTSVSTIDETPSGAVDVVTFVLRGQEFMAISAGPMFTFTEAISFVVHCDTQEEIDHFWEKLSAVPEAEQCGWCKDKYGVSWQVVPTVLSTLISGGTPEQAKRVTQAFLSMKKFNIAALEAAAQGGQ